MERWKYSESENMITSALERFQAFLDPLYGSLRIEAYWVKVADNGDNPPMVGPLLQGVSRSYSSLIVANQSALTFPAFPAIAARFESEPFTAIADLLEALREVQALEESERLTQLSLNHPDEPPFEGGP